LMRSGGFADLPGLGDLEGLSPVIVFVCVRCLLSICVLTKGRKPRRHRSAFGGAWFIEFIEKYTELKAPCYFTFSPLQGAKGEVTR